MTNNNHYDVIIIGTGAGGAAGPGSAILAILTAR